MDKFGIFKLLSSFYDYYDKNKGNLPSLSSTISAPTITKNEPEKIEKAYLPPLQSSMLNTMTSHDELVKRVMQNQKKQGPNN